MFSLFKNAPQLKERNSHFRIILLIMAVISSSFILAPVLVGFMSNFTARDESALYCLCKGIFGISLIAGVSLIAVDKKIYHAVYPCIFGFFTALFPLFGSIGDYQYVKSVAEKFSMAQDYSAYWISIGVYLLYAILCVFTALYVSGYFKWSVVILVLSALSSLATVFIAIDKSITYDTTTFEILILTSIAFTSLMPVVLVSSTQRSVSKAKTASTHYSKRG